MAEDWRNRRERSNRFAMRLLVWITLGLGRRVSSWVMVLITGYFLLFAGGARRAARGWLARTLDHAPTWRDLWRQLYTFGRVALDRVYFFRGEFARFDIRRHDRKILYELYDRQRGFILMVSHLGSVEVMRTMGLSHHMPINIVMDRSAGQKANVLLDAINPALSASILDTSQGDVDLVLKIKAALDRGEIVGMMADRRQPGDKAVSCKFLGEQAEFPASPWLLAGLLKVPVVLAFGIYQGGARYDLYFELFAEQLQVPRRSREQAVAAYAQRYADRLAHYGRNSPYNWFNFYDFWQA